jgi:hypothetical protein
VSNIAALLHLATRGAAFFGVSRAASDGIFDATTGVV